MVELAAHKKGARPPAWLLEIPPLEAPHFATPLSGLRLHLLRSSPVSFRRRNLFVDSSIGDRYERPVTQLRKADIERLLRLLDAELATRYFDESQLAPKTRLALEELLAPRPG